MTALEMDKIVQKVAEANGIKLPGTMPSLVELASEMADRKQCEYRDDDDLSRIMAMDEGPMWAMLESMAKDVEPANAEEWAEMLIDNGLEWDPVLYQMVTHSGIPRDLFRN